jgi:RND family efflux transporter MFP subunit
MHGQVSSQVNKPERRAMRLALWSSLGFITAIVVTDTLLMSRAYAQRDGSSGPPAARCLIKPFAEVAVGTPVEGVIDVIAVEQGDAVKAGQVLVKLESSREQATVAYAASKADMEAAVKAAEVKIEFTKRKVARTRDLIRTAAVGQHELDEAETEQRLAESSYLEAKENQRLAQLELQRANVELALRTIRSPINGVVVERLLTAGELARQSPILRLAQLDPLLVEVFAPVEWLSAIVQHTELEVIPDGASSNAYRARVEVVNRIVDSATGTFGVRLRLPNADFRIPAGLNCNVRLAAKPAP